MSKLENLPFVPSLGWWAARAIAQHKKQCKRSNCKKCAQATSHGGATPHALERIDRAAQGLDVFRWTFAALTHADSDFQKMQIVEAWRDPRPYNKQISAIRIAKTTKVEFMFHGIAVTVELILYSAKRFGKWPRLHKVLRWNDQLWRMGSNPLIGSCYPTSVPQSKDKRTFATAFLSYGGPSEETLSLALENDILRLTWIPLSAIYIDYSRIKIKYTKTCEYTKLGPPQCEDGYPIVW
jgi:hypothetical protein